MKLITRDTDYAIRALCAIGNSRRSRVSADELVVKLKMPKPFLRKILQALNKNKVLISYKGSGGGFSLSRDPRDISLIDLIRIFQGPLKLNQCTFKRSVCPELKVCKVRRKIDNIQKYVIDQLKGVTIASLLKKGSHDG